MCLSQTTGWHLFELCVRIKLCPATETDFSLVRYSYTLSVKLKNWFSLYPEIMIIFAHWSESEYLIIYLNCRERYEDISVHQSYMHKLCSCEIEARKKLRLEQNSNPGIPVQCSPTELSSQLGTGQKVIL